MEKTPTGFRRDPDFRIVIIALVALLLVYVLNGLKDEPTKQETSPTIIVNK